MSSTQFHSQVPHLGTAWTHNAAPPAENTFYDVELGTMPPRRANDGQASHRPAPAAPQAVAHEDQRVTDPRSWWITGGAALAGFVIGGISAGAYAANQAGLRANQGDPCYTDDNGNSVCTSQPDYSTKGSIITVCLVVPTICLAALSVGSLLWTGNWSITRGALQARREAAAARRDNGTRYRPDSNAVWNQNMTNLQNVRSDQQAIGNGQLPTYGPAPFRW